MPENSFEVDGIDHRLSPETVIMTKAEGSNFRIIESVGTTLASVYQSSTSHCRIMTTLSNWNSFRVTGPLCGEVTGHRWIPLTKASDAELSTFSLIFAWTDDWVNNRDAGALKRHRALYDVTVMSVLPVITGRVCTKVALFTVSVGLHCGAYLYWDWSTLREDYL